MQRDFGTHSVINRAKPNREMTMNISTPSTALRGLIAAAIFGALASTYSAVSAADPARSAGITVRYADINVASPAGARVLYERIRAAAQSACNYFWFKTDADEARCLKNTIANAVNQVDEPALTALYNAKFKTPAPTPLLSQSH
jgi:UrcA family protein